jgi:hypothetical protein
MNAKQFAAQMKATIENVKAQGTAAIYCDNIIAYLDSVINSPEPEPTQVDIERYKAELQNTIEATKHHLQSSLEMFRSVIGAGQSAIKSSFLLNGGAAVALLAFIAHLAQFGAAKVPTFAACLLPFAFGALAIVVTSGLTYLSQWFYAGAVAGAWGKKVGFGLNIMCIVLGIASYGLFAWGLFATYATFIEYR